MRTFFFFFFSYVPYYPIRRVNKPNLGGPYIWASSHSNFLCDVVPAGFEGDCPTKFLAKSTLFTFPIKGLIEFLGALPIIRAEELKGLSKDARSAKNKSTFQDATRAFQKGWPLAIFPEGTSIVSPGLVLPLKNGVAKLAFAAEKESDFTLNLRIIPVGLEYGSRVHVGSGLTIRYGKPLWIKDYKQAWHLNEGDAVRKLMEDLTREMVSIFPHFASESHLVFGKKLVALGQADSRHAAAQLFLQKKDDSHFWQVFEDRLRHLEERSKEAGLPLSAWGHVKNWRKLNLPSRIWSIVFLGCAAPLALFGMGNSSFPEYIISSLVDYFSVDETEKMSLRFILSLFILPLVYGFQFMIFKFLLFDAWMREMAWLPYVIYTGSSFVLWYLSLHWRLHLKRITGIYFFWRADRKRLHTAREKYRALMEHLSDLHSSSS